MFFGIYEFLGCPVVNWGIELFFHFDFFILLFSESSKRQSALYFRVRIFAIFVLFYHLL